MSPKEIKNEWLNRLRNTPVDRQITGDLCVKSRITGLECYCAMGVLAELLVENKLADVSSEHNVDYKVYIDKNGRYFSIVIPSHYLEYLQIEDDVQKSVLNLNDEFKKPFAVIADDLKKSYPSTFD